LTKNIRTKQCHVIYVCANCTTLYQQCYDLLTLLWYWYLHPQCCQWYSVRPTADHLAVHLIHHQCILQLFAHAALSVSL